MSQINQLPELVFLSATPNFGGGERSARDVLLVLAKRNWTITIVAPSNSRLLEDKELRETCALNSINLAARWPNVLALVSSLWKLLRLARQHPHAIFYGNGYLSLKWLAACSQQAHVASVCHLRETVTESYSSRRARFFSRYPSAFIAISDSVKAAFCAGTGLDADHVYTVHNGLPVPLSLLGKDEAKRALHQTYDIPDRHRIVTFVSALARDKGHILLLDAIEQMNRTTHDTTFLFIGVESRNAAQHVLERQVRGAREAKKLSNVVLSGYVEHPDPIMRGSDIVVVPSQREGFGRTAIEAMMQGTPVVAAAVGGLREIIEDRSTGLLFESGNSQKLAESILLLLADDDLRSQLAQRALVTATERFNIERTVDGVETRLHALRSQRSS
ncbi:MAG: glycosyltransferase family 4 protein [Lentisphaerae bacterium]|nr:glycosyltransferase family 4 protein [Lentisphaerota bacterium]